VVPGLPTKFDFTPILTTNEMRVKLENPNFDYILLCNKICGSAHYRMKMVIIVDTKADYEKWLIELVAKDNQVSTLQAEEYLDILYSTKNGKGEILNLCQKYGTPEKEITSLKLKI
jgi:heme/copper-type cytochrome/quinol oxidase subunit 2